MAKSKNRPKREKARPTRQAELRAQRQQKLAESARQDRAGTFDRMERGGLNRAG